MEDSGLGVFCSDSVLINGRGAVYCPRTEKISSLELSYLKTATDNQPLSDKGCTPTTGLHEIIEVDPKSGWVSLKFTSAASLKSLMFSIDEHPMYICEVDGSYVEPQLAQSVTIFRGERYAAIIKLDKGWKDYTIRVPDTQGDQVVSGFATMRYKGSQNTTHLGLMLTTVAETRLLLSAIKPYPPVTIPKSADQLVNLTLGRVGSAYTWSTSGGGFYDMMANWDDPILYDVNAKNNLDPRVTIQTKNGTWVDLLLQLGEMPNTPGI
ncbi:Multicopper oxidase type 2 [Penicillium antarcticum]|uniref:Multicopper oxidase type 2 n=1 Tax=Penicillium antarcticum TaxID=416450 RepID=UPI0023865D08|nr:Multicopper oxidase type 2 [Penicillium antarcticum]KAJ5318031.1 Multicopper oxidase type 2 [Penicillium antarcticum]